ncbi:MAG: phosphoribosyl-ATP pyrophosphohydrolase [Eubacteriales bacterium]
MKYNKLIRDKIPRIIQKNGQNARIRVLGDDEYLRMLDRKLDEELAEYHADGRVEELADLLEVIYAAALARGVSAAELDRIRREKAEKRGVFAEKLLLEEVIED